MQSARESSFPALSLITQHVVAQATYFCIRNDFVSIDNLNIATQIDFL